ncbi:MAG: hypothetical protein ACKOEC_20885 [Acidimicrobiia bacterium]
MIIRLALTVQFLGVLAVPTMLAAAQAPKGTWMAEWLRPNTNERTMGVLILRDGKVSFAQDVGDVGWEVELADVKRVTPSKDGRAVLIQTASGEEYVTAVMDPSMTRIQPKRVVSVIEQALKLLAQSSR